MAKKVAENPRASNNETTRRQSGRAKWRSGGEVDRKEGGQEVEAKEEFTREANHKQAATKDQQRRERKVATHKRNTPYVSLPVIKQRSLQPTGDLFLATSFYGAQSTQRLTSTSEVGHAARTKTSMPATGWSRLHTDLEKR